MLGGVIFDLDGTLGDTLPVCYAAFRTVFREYLGVEYSDAEIHGMFGPTEEGILAGHLPADGDAPLRAYLSAYEASHHLAPTPFAGIPELLDELAARSVPVAVVTGKGPRSAALSLEAWGVQDRFTHVKAGGDNGNIKDLNMRTVVGDWGVEAATVVSVGDAPSDVTAARSAGIVAAGAAWASTADPDRVTRAGPDALFLAVAEFSDWLRER